MNPFWVFLTMTVAIIVILAVATVNNIYEHNQAMLAEKNAVIAQMQQQLSECEKDINAAQVKCEINSLGRDTVVERLRNAGQVRAD